MGREWNGPRYRTNNPVISVTLFVFGTAIKNVGPAERYSSRAEALCGRWRA